MSLLLGIPGGAPLPTPSDPGLLPVESPWTGLRPTWTGWDGSVWDLSGRTGGVVLLQGFRGVSMPPLDRYSDESPAVAGSRWRGWRAKEREVFWPLAVYKQASSREWVEYDRAFWKTMRPDRPGVWTVTHPDGTSRSLVCRFVDDGGQTFDVMPMVNGWASYGITLVAEMPFWTGDPISRVFEEEPAQDFFGGDESPSGGPPFYISASNTLASATMTNPGDVDAFPVYVIEGPTSSVTVGFGSQVVTVPFAIPDGVSLTVYTDPTAQYAIDSLGVDRTGQLTNPSFAAIPPGEEVPVSLSMTGTGRVLVQLVPRWFRAW